MSPVMDTSIIEGSDHSREPSVDEVRLHLERNGPGDKDVPAWVLQMIATKFYGPCDIHSERRNELNLFCGDTGERICQHCRPMYKNCTVIHVCRYMYHDVVPLKDLSPFVDCSLIQGYLNNGHRVLYLDRRSQPRSKQMQQSSTCSVCSRTLQDGYRFCSVWCRLAYDPSRFSSSEASLESIDDPTEKLMPLPRSRKYSAQSGKSRSMAVAGVDMKGAHHRRKGTMQRVEEIGDRRWASWAKDEVVVLVFCA